MLFFNNVHGTKCPGRNVRGRNVRDEMSGDEMSMGRNVRIPSTLQLGKNTTIFEMEVVYINIDF